MSLSALKAAGEMAGRVAEAAVSIYERHNEYKTDFDTMTALVISVYPTKTIGTMTDAELNTLMFGDRGTADELSEAQLILGHWEAILSTMKSATDELPANN